MKIRDLQGERSDPHKDSETISTATVQLGENNLSQVAQRLGIDTDGLLRANPEIKDPSRLNVSQEIHLPPRPTPKSESGVATPPATIHAWDLPKAPLRDPLVATLVKESLLASKSAKLHADNAQIDKEVKEAGQKFENAMDAANTQMALGATDGVAVAARGLQSTGDNLGQIIGHKSNTSQAQELPEASMEYLIGIAAALERGEHSKEIAQLANDLAKLKSSKFQRLTTDESKTQSTPSDTENNQDAANQGIDRRKFIKP